MLCLLQVRSLNFDPEYKNAKEPVLVQAVPANLRTLRCNAEIFKASDLTNKFNKVIRERVFEKGDYSFLLDYVVIGPLKKSDHVSTGML